MVLADGVDGRHTAGLRLAATAKSAPAATAAWATWRADSPASARTRGRPSPACLGSAASARATRPGASGRASVLPATNSAASATPASAQVTSTGRPQRLPA